MAMDTWNEPLQDPDGSLGMIIALGMVYLKVNKQLENVNKQLLNLVAERVTEIRVSGTSLVMSLYKILMGHTAEKC